MPVFLIAELLAQSDLFDPHADWDDRDEEAVRLPRRLGEKGRSRGDGAWRGEEEANAPKPGRRLH